jgi:anti-sigma factor RsiW
LRCEDFAEWFSDCIDGNLVEAGREELNGHLRFCPHCRKALEDMRQVRQMVGSLRMDNPPAAFLLRLDCAVNSELRQSRCRAWVRPVTWSFAFALAILLWPDFDEAQTEHARADLPEWAVPAGSSQYGPWDAQFPDMVPAQTYSHAKLPTVSF